MFFSFTNKFCCRLSSMFPPSQVPSSKALQCICLIVCCFLYLKNCWFLASMVCCVISQIWLFCKGMLKCLVHKCWQDQVEVRIGMKKNLAKALENFYATIWSFMKLEDMLKVLPMLMLDNFVNKLVLIWEHEQCSNMSSEISHGSHYYLKDLKGM